MLVTTGRFTSHIAIIAVALLAVILAGARITGTAAPKPGGKPNAGANPIPNPLAADQPNAGGGLAGRVFSPAALSSYISIINQDGGLMSRRAVAETIAPTESRSGIITYTVQAGDSIETIAARFRLLPTTLVWSNKDVEEAPDRLSIGQTIFIPPIDGIWYTVESDDTITGIADKFKAKPDEIISYPMNNLAGGANLLSGARIMIPNGVKPFVDKPVEAAATTSNGSAYSTYSGPAVNAAASGQFQWPTTGMLTQGYYAYHRGIDIAKAVGIPIAASDGGYVSAAGWDGTGYGYRIIINHGNGFSTLYGHLSQYYVEPGQAVARGQIIAAMGSTGRSTGPHLHFEVRYGGVQQNPLFYLP
jgi:murein DD-endopeptidase MepM/ murein hydrolase activator NlpD